MLYHEGVYVGEIISIRESWCWSHGVESYWVDYQRDDGELMAAFITPTVIYQGIYTIRCPF